MALVPPSKCRNRIVELATLIAASTHQIDDYLESREIPTPSFDITAPLRIDLPPDIQALQDGVLEASDELTALMTGPLRAVAGQPFNSCLCVQAIERFGIAKAFPVGQTATYTAISEKCGLNESDLRRILRYAMTYHIFREPSKGVVAHTAASKALAVVPSLDHLVGFMGGEMWPSASRLVDALERWPMSEEANEAGFNIAHATDQHMFEVIRKDAARAKRMAGAMTFNQTGPGYQISHLLENFDFGVASRGTIVDVGGGTGGIGISIARYFPLAKVVVQDLPEVIVNGRIPDDLSSQRLQFMAHDFFTAQPVQADMFLLRWVLHDWSDKYAVRILQALRPSLRKGAKVVVAEICLPRPGQLSLLEERRVRMFDLAMKGIQNAKERDPDDWYELFQKADPKFGMQPILKPQSSTLSFIYAIWNGE